MTDFMPIIQLLKRIIKKAGIYKIEYIILVK
jgi:hypothetical protein